MKNRNLPVHPRPNHEHDLDSLKWYDDENARNGHSTNLVGEELERRGIDVEQDVIRDEVLSVQD